MAGQAGRTARFRGVVSLHLRTLRTGGAHDSHHQTAGIAGRTRRLGGMAACGVAVLLGLTGSAWPKGGTGGCADAVIE